MGDVAIKVSFLNALGIIFTETSDNESVFVLFFAAGAVLSV
jgi:hypothetical protein